MTATRDATPAVRPTPTQEENDLAAIGLTPIEKEPDGSEPTEPNGVKRHDHR